MEIIAHRGASAEQLENTLPAVQRAWQLDTDAVEVDVQLTVDGQIVVFHDDDGRRLTGNNWNVSNANWAFLKEQPLQLDRKTGFIPLLESVLSTIPPGKFMVVELKSGPQIVAPLKELIQKMQLQPQQVQFISLIEATILETKNQLPAFHCQRVFEYEGNWPPAQELIDYAAHSPLDGVDPEAGPYLDEVLIGALHRLGKRVYVWTVNEAAQARRLQQAGIDGLTTDRPGWLKQQLGGKNES